MSRQQLTMFVPPPAAEHIEAVRRLWDPVQQQRIAAHVTLCREHELAAIDPLVLRERLAHLTLTRFRMTFGPAERVDGYGVLLRAMEGTEAFAAMRSQILGIANAPPFGAHITLAHPRNPRAPGNSDDLSELFPPGVRIDFAEICLINQVESDPWTVQYRVPLAAPV